MQPIDYERDETCSDCGAPQLMVDPTYAFGTSGTLCFACALKRGGQFDSTHDRWVVAPDVGDLAAREYE